MRYLGVVISGFLGGIGGAIYAQSISVNFSVTTIVGPGFIALAAMIFGKWNPVGAMLSSLFFGLSQSLAVIGSQLPFLQRSSNCLLADCTISLDHRRPSSLLWKSCCTEGGRYQLYQI